MPPASMMTHPASRMTTGRVGGNPCASMRAPHTFGSLPRASPSGTMPHHAPKALPTAAVAATTVPRARRTRRLDEESSEATASSPVKPLDLSSADVEVHAPERPKAPSPAPPPALLKRSATAKSAAAAAAAAARGGAPRAPPLTESNHRTVRPFGADAKGGALAWRPASAKPAPASVRGAAATAARPASAGAVGSRGRGSSSRSSSGSSHPAFAFVVMCCGDEYGDFCCKRHHPDETIYCCEEHKAEKQDLCVASRSRSSLAGRSSTGGSYSSRAHQRARVALHGGASVSRSTSTSALMPADGLQCGVVVADVE